MKGKNIVFNPFMYWGIWHSQCCQEEVTFPKKHTQIEKLTANDYNQGTNVCTEEADKPQTIYTTVYQSL